MKTILRQLLAVLVLWAVGQGAAFAQLSGYHDVANCSILAGWAWDSSQPTTPISVDIYDGSTLVTTVAAGTFRQDLLNAGIGDGNHSFNIPLPGSLIDGQAHTVAIKFAGTQTNLNNTPKTVSCISPGVPTPAYNGYHDVGNCSILAGWAWDANQPTTPIGVDIYDGNTLITTVAASAFRQDLLNAGIGDGNHSFNIPLPSSLINGQFHTVTIKFAGTQTNLNTTPKTIGCLSAGVPIPAYNGYHDSATCTAIAGWAWDANQPTTPISVDIYSDNTLVATIAASQFRQDLLTAGIGDGNHSFSFTVPNSLKDNQTHSIAVKFAGTQTNLNTTPKTIQCASTALNLYFIHPDHLNTPRLVADATGTTVWKWDQQEPFGNDTPNGDPGNTGTAFDLPLRFPGQYADKETNLSYNGARDYDSQIGGYKQSDLIGLKSGLNTYSYVGANPSARTDPFGLWWPGVHSSQSYTAATASGYSSAWANRLGQLTAAVDSAPNSQEPEESVRHAMRDQLTTPERARVDYKQYVSERLKTCNVADLAAALHAVQDSFAHENFPVWNGIRSSTFPELLGKIWHVINDSGVVPWMWGDLSRSSRATQEYLNAWKQRCGCGV